MNQNPPQVTNEKLFKEFQTVVAESEQLLRSVATAGNEQASAARASVEDNFAAASERLLQIRDDAMNQANAAARATDTYVKDNPWRAVGIVAGVAGLAGLVTGLLISRR